MPVLGVGRIDRVQRESKVARKCFYEFLIILRKVSTNFSYAATFFCSFYITLTYCVFSFTFPHIEKIDPTSRDGDARADRAVVPSPHSVVRILYHIPGQYVPRKVFLFFYHSENHAIEYRPKSRRAPFISAVSGTCPGRFFVSEFGMDAG